MKKTPFIISFLLIASFANSQGYKLFIDDNGKSINSFTATSYINVKQLADTAWLMQQYDMKNAILQSGMFKDKHLKIPNGKFIYYRKLNFYNNAAMKEALKSDTTNYIMTEGEFKDGKKNGAWIDYFIGGKKKEEAFYKDGVPNGPYRSYNDDHITVALSGNYVDGKREGEWQMFNFEGKVIETDKYRNGKMYNRKMTLDPYNPPKMPNGFETYVDNALKKAIPAKDLENTAITYTIIFQLQSTGKLLNPKPCR